MTVIYVNITEYAHEIMKFSHKEKPRGLIAKIFTLGNTSKRKKIILKGTPEIQERVMGT